MDASPVHQKVKGSLVPMTFLRPELLPREPISTTLAVPRFFSVSCLPKVKKTAAPAGAGVVVYHGRSCCGTPSVRLHPPGLRFLFQHDLRVGTRGDRRHCGRPHVTWPESSHNCIRQGSLVFLWLLLFKLWFWECRRGVGCARHRLEGSMDIAHQNVNHTSQPVLESSRKVHL